MILPSGCSWWAQNKIKKEQDNWTIEEKKLVDVLLLCTQLKKDTKSWIFIWKDFPPLLLAWLLALFSTFLPTSCFCSRQQIDRKSCFGGLIMWLFQVFPFLASVFCTHKLRHFILEKDKPVFQAATEKGKEARKEEERRGQATKWNKMKKKN